MRSLISIQRQQGAIAIYLSLVLLVLVTMVTLSVTHSVLMEHRISDNESRTHQAFEAAETGAQSAMAWLKDPLNFTVGTTPLTNMKPAVEAAASPLPNGATFTVVANYVAGTDNLIQIVSTGVSNDATATHTINLILGIQGGLTGTPMWPMNLRGAALQLNGTAQIENAYANATIRAGGNIAALAGDNETFICNACAKENPNQTPGLVTSTQPSIAPGVAPNLAAEFDSGVSGIYKNATIGYIANDPYFNSVNANDFFRDFFGGDLASVRAASYPYVYTGFDNRMQNAVNRMIFVEGNLTFHNNDRIGCSRVGGACTLADVGPVLMVVNGNMTAHGGEFFGVLYVTGNLTINGGLRVWGSVVAAGNLDKENGNAEIRYFPMGADAKALMYSRTLVAGTWRDW